MRGGADACVRVVETRLDEMYGWRVPRGGAEACVRIVVLCGGQLMGRLERRVGLLYMEVAAIAYPAHNYDVRRETHMG